MTTQRRWKPVFDLAAARTGTDRLRTWLVDGRQRRTVDPAEVVARAHASASMVDIDAELRQAVRVQEPSFRTT